VILFSNGVFVVPVWFESVIEGVDMWFNEHEPKNIPK
jgi:hypothetical protein